MKTGYFPGCSLHATAREFDESLRQVVAALEIELEEVRDWACCGASSAHATSHLLGVALPARTLALAARQELATLLAPCAACFSRLAAARRALDDAALRARVSAILGDELTTLPRVVSIIELLAPLVERLRAKVTVPLTGLKVACYYGCLLVRPPAVGFDDPEAPQSMEAIARACGAEPVRWNLALECCGGGFSLARTASVVRLGRAILDDARGAGADLIVVACPMCHSNLDFRQAAISGRQGEAGLPVLFVPQLVGWSLGLQPPRLGLGRHFVSPLPLLERVAAARPLLTDGKQA